MKFELIQIFDFLRTWCFSLDDSLSRGVLGNQPAVNSILNCPFKLVMKVHCCLSFMVNGIIIQKLLVCNTVEITETQIGNELFKPSFGHQIFIHSHLADCPLFVDVNPLRIIVAEQVC